MLIGYMDNTYNNNNLAMVKHCSQQMSAAVNREASRNVIRKASQMIDKAICLPSGYNYMDIT